MESAGKLVEVVVNSGGYAALCVLLVFQLRECNQVVRDNTAAIAGLLEHLKGGGRNADNA